MDVQVIDNNFRRKLLASAELLRLVASGVTVCILIGGQCRIDDGGVGADSDERVRPTRLSQHFVRRDKRAQIDHLRLRSIAQFGSRKRGSILVAFASQQRAALTTIQGHHDVSGDVRGSCAVSIRGPHRLLSNRVNQVG